jgi:hypothetical protein
MVFGTIEEGWPSTYQRIGFTVIFVCFNALEVAWSQVT